MPSDILKGTQQAFRAVQKSLLSKQLVAGVVAAFAIGIGADLTVGAGMAGIDLVREAVHMMHGQPPTPLSIGQVRRTLRVTSRHIV